MSEINQNENKDTSKELPTVVGEKSDKDLGAQSGSEKNQDDGLPEGVRKRFAKLTREKYEANSKYETLRSELDAIKSSLEKPKEYSSKEEEISDLVAKEISNREEAAKKQKEKADKVSKYVEKYGNTDEHVKEFEDFEDVINTTEIDLNNPVDRDIADFCINSDSGKRLTYELCKSPELLETLRQMSYSVRAKTLIKLDEKLYEGISAKKAEAIVEKTVDEAAENKPTQKKQAPKLITPVTGKTVPKGKGPLSMDEYIEARNQRLANKK